MTLTEQELAQKIKELGYGVGFDLLGISALEATGWEESFSNWLKKGYAGEMEYLRKTAPQRMNPQEWLPWAKSVISVGLSYATPDSVEEPEFQGEVSRYARGRDYHLVIEEKIHLLLSLLDRVLGQPVRAKIAVDSSPVLERAFAARSGLGWTGKNTLLISPRLGSYLFLGELFIDLKATPDRPMANRCGQCRRCLDACPTQAFVGPYVLDARRCISYLTIELKGAIPRPLRRLVGARIFGCDICQQVCPYNVRVPTTRETTFLSVLETGSTSDLESLLDLSDAEFKTRFRESPILRAKRRGFLRNIMVVLGNRRDPLLVPTLIRFFERDPEPLVRGHAAWALGEIGTGPAREALERSQLTEQDQFVLEEVQAALERSREAGEKAASPADKN